MSTKKNGADKNGGSTSARHAEAGRRRVSSSDQLPHSKKIYLSGSLHVDLRMPYFVIPSGVEGSLTVSLVI
jgi:hypothetical protein